MHQNPLSQTRVIAVSSGKGGVGKSTVSVNLALTLAQGGKTVALLDADIHGPSCPQLLGVRGEPTGIRKPDGQEALLPPEENGVRIMSMGFFMGPDEPAQWRGPVVHQALEKLCHTVEWGNPDFLVVDLPPGTGDVQLSLGQLLDFEGVILVTTPQQVAVSDVRRAFNQWEKNKIPVLGIVENMSYLSLPDGTRMAVFGTGGGEILSEKFNLELLAKLPLIPAMGEAMDRGRSPVAHEPDSLAAHLFADLARKIMGHMNGKGARD